MKQPKPSHIAAMEKRSNIGNQILSELQVKPSKGSEDNLSGVLVYGDWGVGKTFLLTEAILRGKNIFVVTTELGRNGLRTIREELKKLGKADLFDNQVYSWEPESGSAGYEQMQAFIQSDYMEKQLDGWKPDIDVWEGISTFQINDVDEYVLMMESKEMKDSELRDAALVSSRQDWAAIKRGTLRTLGLWTNKKWYGQKVHKFATMDEEVKEEEVVGIPVKRIRPYLQGAAAKMVAKPFDLILRVHTKRDPKNPKDPYKRYYTTHDPTGKVSVKKRGLVLPDEFEADPGLVWDALL